MTTEKERFAAVQGLADALANMSEMIVKQVVTTPATGMAGPSAPLRQPLDIDWNALKIAVQAKIVDEDRPTEVIGRRIHVPQLSAWIRKRNAHLTPEAYFRVVQWLGARPEDFLFRVDA